MPIRRRAPLRASPNINAPHTAASLLPFDPDALERLRRKARPDKKTGCVLWIGSRGDHGYGFVGFGSKSWLAHRLAWYAHHGPIPKGQFVCHSCDNRRCIAIEHLFLGTPQENVTDMIRKGRGRWKSRLEEKQVVDIKRQLTGGEPVSGIAKQYGVTYATILAIKAGRNWRHIEPTGALPEGRGHILVDNTRIPILEFRSTG